MKVETKVLSDARLSIQVMENDGSPIATREIGRDEAINLFAKWALVFLPTTGGSRVTFEGGSKDIFLAVKDKTPLPEKESAADEKEQSLNK